MLFGPQGDRRSGETPLAARRQLQKNAQQSAPMRAAQIAAAAPAAPVKLAAAHGNAYQDAKQSIFTALFDTIDITAVTGMDVAKARREVTEVVTEIISLKDIKLSTSEQMQIAAEISDELFGFGPLEPLLARDDIGDIMVNGYDNVFIETGGIIEKTDVKFRDNKHLFEICQRIVSKVGRHVDSSAPSCDARLEDGSRVNVVVPPLAIHGPVLTIRKFKRDRLRLRDLVDFGSISPAGAKILAIISASQCNVIISGGTGSGKTTLLNCMTAFFNSRERIVTLEDTAELQLQQPHVVSLETRPPNIEGKGEVTMRALIKNCLRMRPERIILGEVRGPEALDLMQAMNTGHDGSMGTLHSNTPRDALSRLEAMITMGASGLPINIIREMIVGSVDIIIQTSRLRDGSRRITHITEVVGIDSGVILTQDLLTYKIDGEDKHGNIIGHFESSGIARPNMWDRAVYFGLAQRLTKALEEAGAPKLRPDTKNHANQNAA